MIKVDGEGHLMNLVKEWGYEPLLPANLPTFPPLHPVMYCVVGLTILISGAYLFILPPPPATLSTPFILY
jgi:hypothetical protein